MANIVTVAVPAFIEESSEYDTQYKRTMIWDPVKGDFVRNAANQRATKAVLRASTSTHFALL